MSHKSSAQALHWIILCEDSWLQPPFWLCDWARPGHCTRSPQTQWSECFPGHGRGCPSTCVQDVLERGGSHSTSSKDGGWNHGTNLQILSRPTAYSLQEGQEPLGISDGLEEFPC